jgi:hypothetical protein
MKAKIFYFDEVKKENTEQTFKIARQRGEELGIKTFVVASTTGWTGVQAMQAFSGMKLIVVSHCYGYPQPNSWSFKDENLQLLKSKGIPIVTAAHAFGGIIIKSVRTAPRNTSHQHLRLFWWGLRHKKWYNYWGQVKIPDICDALNVPFESYPSFLWRKRGQYP